MNNENALSQLKLGDEASLPGQEIIYQWRHAWMRAISKAWADEEYKENLLSKDVSKVKKAFEEVGFSGHAIGGGQEINFWDLITITVEETEAHPQYEPSDTNNGWLNAKEGKIKNGITPELKLHLPPAPEPKDQAMAITDYMAAGMIYPITGCC